MATGKLSDHAAAATICVSDAKKARDFYEGVLGLRVVMFDENSGVATYTSASSQLDIYQSDENAGKNPATSATWGVGPDFDAVMAALTSAGVAFEHYDDMGMQRDGDVHLMGDFKAAWFKDPDGNILHVNNM